MHYRIRKTLLLGLCMSLIIGLSCVKKNKLSTVSEITIYFVDWSLTTYSRMTCDDLKADHLSRIVTISDRDQVKKFIRMLKNAHYEEQAEYDGLDVRICCLLQDNEKNILAEVSFSPTSQMQVDDKVYITDESLLGLVVGYLPAGYLGK